MSVLSVLTTRACGKARCTCSPSESVSLTKRVGGKPFEKSSGFEMSRSELAGQVVGAGQARAPASAPAPLVALTTSSARGRGVGEGGERDARAWSACPGRERRVAHAVGLGAGEGGLRVAGADGDRRGRGRDRRAAMVWPTMPVPRTAIFMGVSCVLVR